MLFFAITDTPMSPIEDNKVVKNEPVFVKYICVTNDVALLKISGVYARFIWEADIPTALAGI
jgi:hypothetical protein